MTVWTALVVPSNWEPNVTDAGVTDVMGAIPMPVSETVAVLPAALEPLGALELMSSDPEMLPRAVGANVTSMLQLAPAGTELPQLFVCAKFGELWIAKIVSGWLPALSIVTTWS